MMHESKRLQTRRRAGTLITPSSRQPLLTYPLTQRLLNWWLGTTYIEFDLTAYVGPFTLIHAFTNHKNNFNLDSILLTDICQ